MTGPYRFPAGPGVYVVMQRPQVYRIERGGVLLPAVFRERVAAFLAAIKESVR